ncbi:MAG: hypothetical protein AAFP07_22675, partial [Cyanobacteria bacterium J06606_4]
LQQPTTAPLGPHSTPNRLLPHSPILLSTHKCTISPSTAPSDSLPEDDPLWRGGRSAAQVGVGPPLRN